MPLTTRRSARSRPAGIVTTAAGTPGVTGSGADEVDNLLHLSTPLPGSFRTPHHLALSARGLLIVTVGDGILRVEL